MDTHVKLGRPTLYSEEMGKRICEAIACSDRGLRKTLEMDPELPIYGTVLGWLNKYASFYEAYARAKQQQLESMAEDIVDISNDDALDANDKRIRIDTRKWLLSKLIPKTYGDKIDVTSDGKALAVPTHSIDARVQSIIMQAYQRKQGVELLGELGEEAKSLLE